MINKILLCGHTGSKNRGCEAIVRSTVAIFKQLNIKYIDTLTWDMGYDVKLNLDKITNLTKYPKKNLLNRIIYLIYSIVFHNQTLKNRFYYNRILKKCDTNTLIVNIGGDTYCYGDAWLSYALNDLSERKHLKTLFWGCSIDEYALQSKVMQRDLNKYSGIFVRESLSENILKQVVLDKAKIVNVCDPAFHLNLKETEFPLGFKKNNTIGINISESTEMVDKNIDCLVNWIIENTSMQICFIPHGYTVNPDTEDYKSLKKYYEKYKNTNRVCIVDKELSCCELKYIISNCRFFVGARTHSCIAAYSTGVPTLALSYSIKSKGIAKDLFEKEEDLVVSWRKLKNDFEIRDAFINGILKNEKEIKELYKSTLPIYKDSIINATRDFLSKN